MYSSKLTWDTQDISGRAVLLFLMESSSKMIILELEGTLEVISLSFFLLWVRKLRPVIDMTRHSYTAGRKPLGKPRNRCRLTWISWSIESDTLGEQFINVNVLLHLSSFLNVQQPPKNENLSQLH